MLQLSSLLTCIVSQMDIIFHCGSVHTEQICCLCPLKFIKACFEKSSSSRSKTYLLKQGTSSDIPTKPAANSWCPQIVKVRNNQGIYFWPGKVRENVYNARSQGKRSKKCQKLKNIKTKMFFSLNYFFFKSVYNIIVFTQ